MTQLGESIERASALISNRDLSQAAEVEELLRETHYRRSIDLSDLDSSEQAALIAARTHLIQPSCEELAARITQARQHNRPFVAKFGIDPTGADVHVGHAVPMQILSRFQRMGHAVVFVVGDVTATIGDPSGRSDDRPALSEQDIERNLATYQEQVSPYFDFSAAQFSRNSEWLDSINLTELIEILAKIPVSMPLQRSDFRTRIEAGHGLSMAELIYSVVMALDSVAINCDVEVGGRDQFLNMQMCRKVMEIRGQRPEVVVATEILEGTDGTGAKMSKSKGNYIPIGAEPADIFGRIMSVPDRLIGPYFRSLSEWSDHELELLGAKVEARALSAMDAKKILAGEVCASIHGVTAAMAARGRFEAQFSNRKFSELPNLPTVEHAAESIVAIVRSLGFARSNSEARSLARQNGLRLVFENDNGQEERIIKPDEVYDSLASVLRDHPEHSAFLKVGRKLARIAR